MKKIYKILKREIAVLLIILMVSSMFLIIVNNSFASTRYDFSSFDNSKFPGYKDLINNLKSKHPNWKFTILETGLDWEQVIAAEKGDKSLIQGKSGNWVSGGYDSSWSRASESAIRYYMDPRNWLSEDAYVIQFMQLSYTEISDDNLSKAASGTFLENKEYITQINKSCKEQNVNAIYVIARILQEQGNPKTSATFEMDGGDGNKYYNLFNIGATGAGNAQIIANALDYAKRNGWTSIAACIRDGIKLLAYYNSVWQNTLYLNKFDVDECKGTYSNQYMQNIEAPKSEGYKMYTMMKSANLLDDLTFVIPVFYNMPSSASLSPDRLGELGPINIRVKTGHDNINIRSEANTNSSIVKVIDSGEVLLSVQRFSDGWHKVYVEKDGTYKPGYIKYESSYLENIPDVTNCTEVMTISEDSIPLMAGPNDTEQRKLAKGQIITRIDNSAKYKINDVVWDRIQLSNGTQGFVNRKYLLTEKESEIYVINTQTDPLSLKDSPAGNTIRWMDKGTRVTRTEIATSTKSLNGVEYYWDKVTTPDGAVGYCARYYLADLNGNPATDKTYALASYTGTSISKIDKEKIIKMEPNTTVKDLKSLGSIKVTTADGKKEIKDDEIIGTGYKIVIGGKTYTAVKLGDVNGDGYVKANDYLIIKDYIMKQKNIDLKNEFLQAADVTNDKKVKANDYLKIKDHIMYGISI